MKASPSPFPLPKGERGLGCLFIVATPIGNLQDITHRALEVLRSVDLIACEDTRRTVKLLNHFGIRKPLVSYFRHNQKKRGGELIAGLKEGKNIALVTDAGTPTVSDPGADLVRQAREKGIAVVPIPGPSAVTALLSVSGYDGPVLFYGYLPPKSAARRRVLSSLISPPPPTPSHQGRGALCESPLPREPALSLSKGEGARGRVALLLFEGPHRIQKTLADIIAVLGDREIVVGREMTKVHEEIVVRSAGDWLKSLEGRPPRGEYTVLVLPDPVR